MRDDDLDADLRALPAPDVGHWRRERVRTLARRALSGEAAGATGWKRVYRRFVEPALLVAFCSAQLGWTVVVLTA